MSGHQVQASAEKSELQSDLDLVHQASRGDRAAFHELVDRHAASLFRIARSLSRTRADAEDIVQETLIGAFQGLAGFDGRSSVRTWMTRILMRRAAKEWHRSRHSRASVPLDAAGEQSAVRGSDGDAARSNGSRVGGSTASVDCRLDLAQVLETLGPEHREVLVLRELQGLSYAEIASSLAIPRGTVESRLFRARAELRSRLKGYLAEG